MKDCYTCDEINCAFSGQNFSSKYAASQINAIYCNNRKRAKEQLEAYAKEQVLDIKILRDTLYDVSYCIGSETWVWINPSFMCKGIKPGKALIDAALGKQIIRNVIRPCLTSAKQCEVKYFNLTEIKEEK